MPEEKNGEPGFKVVDRRSFSVDGTPREGDAAADERRQEPPRPAVATPSTQFEAEPEEDLVEGATDFETLVSYLSTTALFQLGLLAGPSGERIPADLLNAQRTINLLEVLQDKTRGNLTSDEERVLEATLYELRLGFVEVDKRQAKKGK
jgi:hypothetical protein